MLVFEANEVYKSRKTGVVKRVSYTYEDSKNSKLYVVFDRHEGLRVSDIINDYDHSTEEGLIKYRTTRENELRKSGAKIDKDRIEIKINSNVTSSIFKDGIFISTIVGEEDKSSSVIQKVDGISVKVGI